MSVRTFTRRFREEVGDQSRAVARPSSGWSGPGGLLEATDLSVDQVAREAGFGTATSHAPAPPGGAGGVTDGVPAHVPGGSGRSLRARTRMRQPLEHQHAARHSPVVRVVRRLREVLHRIRLRDQLVEEQPPCRGTGPRRARCPAAGARSRSGSPGSTCPGTSTTTRNDASASAGGTPSRIAWPCRSSRSIGLPDQLGAAHALEGMVGAGRQDLALRRPAERQEVRRTELPRHRLLRRVGVHRDDPRRAPRSARPGGR